MNRWKLLDTGAGFGAVNMAIDEALLARAQAGGELPVLRFYTWEPSAVSLGRFQKIEDAVDVDACRRRNIDIVRRVTGGRAVLHYHELTYSIVARADDPLFSPTVLGTYKVIAQGLRAGLAHLGISAELVSRSGRHASRVEKSPKDPACFASPSWYELLVAGRKIVGSAQRRMRGAFLQHGSILIDLDQDLEAEVFPGSRTKDHVTSIRGELGRDVPLGEIREAFVKGFSEALGVEFIPADPAAVVMDPKPDQP